MEKKLKNKNQGITNINRYEKIFEEKENLKEKNSSNANQNKEIENKNNNNAIQNNLEMNSDNFAKTQINKPLELKEFDAASHFKENIINFNRNCIDEITDSSYYCFTCKHSVCEKCGVYDHKEHLLIQRDNCINYDKTFFNEISKVIEDSFLIENNRDIIKRNIISTIDNLKIELDFLKNNKLKEIDYVFEEIKKNLVGLKNNYYEAKLAIENYYNKNKTFFNISTNQIIKKEEEEKKSDKNNNDNAQEEYKKILNKDLENTIFLMNFELMNLCDNKNLQVLDSINETKYRINLLISKIQKQNDDFIKEINNNLDINSCYIKFDDYYLDVKLRTKKYNEFINNFRTVLNEIIKKTGDLDKLNDLIGIFDSKNKKGKDILFNQDYFINYNKNNISKNNKYNFEGKLKSQKNNKINPKFIFKKRKNKINSPKILSEDESLNQHKRCLTYNNILTNKKKKEKRKNNFYLMKNKSLKNNSKNRVNSQDKLIKDNKSKQLLNSFQKTHSQIFNNSDEICLNQRIIQRFFAYSIFDLFSKFFKKNENNINNTNNNTKNNNSNNNNNNINTTNNLNTNNINNIYDNLNNLESNIQKKTVNFLSNYTERYNKLKEIAKPIIGTNIIQYFDSLTNQITKIYLNLSKIDHGYTVFPFGCRHIFIDNILYIVGGADNCGTPTNIVLSYNFSQNILLKLPNLNDEHAYHSIEYLDNYDSIIIIGGEKSSSCEIMDLDSKNWIKLPYLNYPRANTNIYYNIFTCYLYTLFGMEGEMTEKNKNSDIIEVLNLNDILNGWKKVNYYRNSGLNIKSNYCITLPFTKDKLLIYGCSSVRSFEKKLFAFFDMNKEECIKVDKDNLELIKLEENEMKFFDYELSKIE